MWISEAINSTPVSQKPERAKVTMATSGAIEAKGSFQTRNFNEFAPFGFASKMPEGTEILMIPTSDGNACCGAKSKGSLLKVGEIMISSPCGGYIYLKADGSVVINGLVIGIDGEIVTSALEEGE